MTIGLRIAANTARRWAGFADEVAGEKGQRAMARAEQLLQPEELKALASMFQAQAARSLAQTYEAEAEREQERLDNEPTEPRMESVRCAGCGADTLVRRPA